MFDHLNIVILDQIEALFPPLSDPLVRELEKTLLADGKPKLRVWMSPDGDRVLVDSSRVFEFCQLHDLPIETSEVFATAATIDEVKFLIRRDRLDLFGMCQQQLAKLEWTMRLTRSSYKIPHGKFSKVHDLWIRLDRAIWQWKDEYANKEE